MKDSSLIDIYISVFLWEILGGTPNLLRRSKQCYILYNYTFKRKLIGKNLQCFFFG